MEAAAAEQAATLEAEATRLAELLAVVTRLAAARPRDSSALRAALIAPVTSGFSDRTLYENGTLLQSALDAVYERRADAVVRTALLRVGAALNRAAENFETGYAASLGSLDRQFAALVTLMRTNHAVLSMQTDCFFALADFLSLNAEFTREGARAGAFTAPFIRLREHSAALVSMAEPVLNRMMLSATAFLSACHFTEYNDFTGTVDAISLVLTHSKDAGAVKQALEVLEVLYCCCDGTDALLALEPDKVKLLASSDLLDWSLVRCLENHEEDRGVVLALLNALQLAAVVYHRLHDHSRTVPVALAVSKLIVRVMLANAGVENMLELGCDGLYTLCFDCGLPRCPRQLNASSLQSAITAGAVVPVATALRSHHSNEEIFIYATHLMACFLSSGAVDVAPFADLVQICVEAVDRLVLVEDAAAPHCRQGCLALFACRAADIACRRAVAGARAVRCGGAGRARGARAPGASTAARRDAAASCAHPRSRA